MTCSRPVLRCQPNGYAGRTGLSTALTVLRDRLFNDPEPDVQAAAADWGALKLTEAFEDLQQLYHH